LVSRLVCHVPSNSAVCSDLIKMFMLLLCPTTL
jgi:hypothetical protein